MVLPAAADNGILLQGAHAGQRLAGIGHLGARPLDGLAGQMRRRGDPAHVLHQIQRRALALEQHGRLAVQNGDLIALFQQIAVLFEHLCRKGRVQQPEHAHRDVNAAQHTVRLGDELRRPLCVWIDDIIGGDVHIIDILLDGGADQIIHIKLR